MLCDFENDWPRNCVKLPLLSTLDDHQHPKWAAVDDKRTPKASTCWSFLTTPTTGHLSVPHRSAHHVMKHVKPISQGESIDPDRRRSSWTPRLSAFRSGHCDHFRRPAALRVFFGRFLPSFCLKRNKLPELKADFLSPLQ